MSFKIPSLVNFMVFKRPRRLENAKKQDEKIVHMKLFDSKSLQAECNDCIIVLLGSLITHPLMWVQSSITVVISSRQP